MIASRAPSAPLRLCGLSVLLLLAAALRFAYPAWDDLLAAHPDERNIVLVTTGLHGLNPYDSGDPGRPQYFAYGHLPVYLLAAVTALVPGDPDPFIRALLAGRALSALADTLTVALVYLLARRFAGYWPAWFAAAACALAPLHVQLAHFYAVDTLLAALTTATVLVALWYAQGGPRAAGWGAAVLAGLAIGTKVTAVVVLLPVVVAYYHHRDAETQSEHRGYDKFAAVAAAATQNKPLRASSASLRLCGNICPPLLVALATFALTNPFALLQPEAFAIATSTQLAMAAGRLDVPYTRQFTGTWPFAYPFAQLALWGLGARSLLAGGPGYAVYRAARRWAAPGEWVVLGWAVPFALLSGASRQVSATRCRSARCRVRGVTARVARRSRGSGAGRARAAAAGMSGALVVTMPRRIRGALRRGYARGAPADPGRRVWTRPYRPARSAATAGNIASDPRRFRAAHAGGTGTRPGGQRLRSAGERASPRRGAAAGRAGRRALRRRRLLLPAPVRRRAGLRVGLQRRARAAGAAARGRRRKLQRVRPPPAAGVRQSRAPAGAVNSGAHRSARLPLISVNARSCYNSHSGEIVTNRFAYSPAADQCHC
jgi:hypothetical protein